MILKNQLRIHNSATDNKKWLRYVENSMLVVNVALLSYHPSRSVLLKECNFCVSTKWIIRNV